MTKNDKCLTCSHRESKGTITTKTLSDNESTGELKRPLFEGITVSENNFCTFKRINLNNIIVKNCSSFTPEKKYNDLDYTDEVFTPEEIFGSLPNRERQKKLVFFK